jgi:hypothetical protein
MLQYKSEPRALLVTNSVQPKVQIASTDELFVQQPQATMVTTYDFNIPRYDE